MPLYRHCAELLEAHRLRLSRRGRVIEGCRRVLRERAGLVTSETRPDYEPAPAARCSAGPRKASAETGDVAPLDVARCGAVSRLLRSQ